MDGKKLLIAGGLTGIIIVLLGSWLFISLNQASADSSTTLQGNAVFNAKTPEEKAIFIAKLNTGNDFANVRVTNVSLTSDGKYWIVRMSNEVDSWVVTIDAKTLMSKNNGGFGQPGNTWRSLDELVAVYIAQLQFGAAGDFIDGRPSKITMDGKEVWKVHIHHDHEYDPERDWYIYVDVATGKSKTTWDEFNKAAGTDGWLTLKEVDDINGFRDALRDLYSE